ncbi:MAG: FtsX-like permease family protein [Dehalococcoidales bacterium]|nr:FtsX-like permease family protein [Dehalococcoidales bacterium]
MLPLKIATRFLKSGKGQTALIVFGIAIAVSVQIFVGLLIIGLQLSLVNSTIGNQPQITIRPAGDNNTIKNWEIIVNQVRNVDGLDKISVTAAGNASVPDDNGILPILVQGFDFQSADRIYGISESIYQGKQIQSLKQVLIGRSLEEELEVEIGDKLPILTPDGGVNLFEIAGFYDLGIESINRSWVITNLVAAQRLFGYRDRVTEIIMTVDQDRLFDADRIAARIQQAVNSEDIEVTNWKDQNEELLSGLEGQSISSGVIQGVVLASVVVAISSVLSITVLQKSRQLGILKAMGITDRDASLIFVFQGLLIGLIGATVGIAMGLGLLYAFNTFTSSAEGTALIEIYIDYNFIIRSWVIAISSSTLAGLIPARRSLKLNPVDVIREG